MGKKLNAEKVQKVIILKGKDMNDYKDVTSFYYCNDWINRPININGYLFVESINNNYVLQIYITVDNGDIYKRTCYTGSWTPWRFVNFNFRGDISGNSNFNTFTTTGIYRYGGVTTVSNRPSYWGVVEVINTEQYVLQRVSGSNGIQQRISYNNGSSWTEWKIV